MQCGTRIELTADADFMPYAMPRKGERGTVVTSEPGFTEIKLDREHTGLAMYGNKIWLTDLAPPFEYKMVNGRVASVCHMVTLAAVLIELMLFCSAVAA